jgi:hypothetical protein
MGAICLLAGGAGIAAARSLIPSGATFRAERVGWGLVLGFALVALSESACLSTGLRPGPLAFLAVAAAAVALGRRFSARATVADPVARPEPVTPLDGLLAGVAAVGVLLYMLRALTEPMWSNDFLAIWGLKGKVIFAARGLPDWLRDPALAGFSHPEYPLGLPLFYAGIASILGRWDDHAMALAFPFVQAATLAVLFGWLRRRGASRRLALVSAALVSLFEPLYSGFLTGMGEVPLSAAMLLLGAALSDALDETDTGALRRLAVASVLAAAIKNEGLLVAAAAAAVAASARAGAPSRGRRWRVAAIALAPALAAAAAGRILRGPAPLRDFDLGLLAPARAPELFGRLAEALRSAGEIAAPTWGGIACVAVLLAAGRRTPRADRLLVIALTCLAVYCTVPAFAVRGPAWLAGTTLFRTAAALVPLAAAAIAGRLGSVFRSPPPAAAPGTGV